MLGVMPITEQGARAAAEALGQSMPYEFFSVARAEAAGVRLYGVRGVRLAVHDDELLLTAVCGYLVDPDAFATSDVEVEMPARDKDGAAARALLRVPQLSTPWRFSYLDAAYKHSAEFSYTARALPDTGVDLVLVRDSGETVQLWRF